jgi:hypothetical protein
MAAISRAESPRQYHFEMRSAAGVLGQHAAAVGFGLSPDVGEAQPSAR